MMAIEPYEFARTAWFRNDFGQSRFLDYLAMLARHREGILASTEFYKQAELEIGQPMTVIYQSQEIPVYVAGYLDFWPSIDPYSRPFIILNLEHFYDYTALEPYNVWYRLSDRGQISNLVESLKKNGVYVTGLRDAQSEVAAMRREPYRMGFFGLLSMGFIVSALVTALGFFAFNFFSIKGRLVQFGALRAMGLSSGQLIGIIGVEQLLVIGSGLGIGAGLGYGISRLFLPLFRFRITDLNPVPPFIILMERSDVTLIFLVVALLFLLVLAALAIVLARMRIDQAIKLGEEA
jgi:putative ABC transport system permease protein